MSPHSVVLRLTPSLVGGFDTYAFQSDGTWNELCRLKSDDLIPSEFWIGGAVVRQMSAVQRKALTDAGAHLHENTQALLAQVSEQFFGKA